MKKLMRYRITAGRAVEVLRNSGITGTVVGSGRVQWTAPYAHYLYEGRVMGPNVPLHEGGQLVGFFSPKAPKKYTGK